MLVVRETDRPEGEHRDRRRTQQRDRRLRNDILRRLQFVLAPLHRDEHAFRDDDGIVHQHHEGDDEGAEGDALEDQPRLLHDDHRAAHGDEQDCPDDESAAHSHREEQHNEDDHDRHSQVQNKFVDRLGHGVRLEGDLVQLHPERDLRAELADAPLDRRAHRDDVAAADRGDADADGAFAVVAKRRGWRINVIAADGRDVSQIDEFAAHHPLRG